MDLFTIERYGCEIYQTTPDDQMRKLKERIERRKSERKSNVEAHVEVQDADKNEGTPKKKAKKEKKEVKVEADMNEVNNINRKSIKSKSKDKRGEKKLISLPENGMKSESSNIASPLEKTRKLKKSKRNADCDSEINTVQDNDPEPPKKYDADDDIVRMSIESVDEENESTVVDETMIRNMKETNVDGGVNESKIKDEKPNERLFLVLGKQTHKKKTKVKRSLPRWLAEPIVLPAGIDAGKVLIADTNFVSENMLKNLNSAEITHFFPVQAYVIPKVLRIKQHSWLPPQDICVQAPTGSGKTLAYTLPIIETLSKKIVRSLYCLVILPSKDLAFQVKQVFEFYTKGTHVKVGLASGVKTFSKEQEMLTVKGPNGYISKVDVLVCTPGRLVDHIKQTEGFSLRHLRFLVIDEADRLLGQDYSGWLGLVMQCHQKLFPLNVRTLQQNSPPLQKLLFSATLTQNPEKLAPLELFKPVLFTSQMESGSRDTDVEHVTDDERFIIPPELVEKIVVVEEGEKPLVLIYLMMTLHRKRVLCFTKSIEGTHRLCVLLKSFGGFTVSEFSSSLSETQRKGTIRDFKSGKIDLLVSSDAMARGIDIEHVSLVVNYDPAASAKTYVHRVGRTARAGMEGEAITILSRKEVFHFKQMMKKLSGSSYSVMKVKKTDIASFEEKYAEALSSLQSIVAEEKRAKHAGILTKKT